MTSDIVSIAPIAQTPAVASPDALKLFALINEALSKKDLMGAYQLAVSLVSMDRTLYKAWGLLGTILHNLRHWEAAATAFSFAHKLAPMETGVLMDYAWNLHLSGRSLEALPLMEECVDEEPDNFLFLTNLSQILLAVDRTHEGLEEAERAFAIVKDQPEKMTHPQLALSLAQLRLGNYAEGLKNYEARFSYRIPEFLHYPYPVWRGEDISDKRLFIPAEQGVGDGVMFLRFIAEAAKRAKHTTVFSHGACLRFYKDNLPAEIDVFPLPRELPPADVFCPILNLPVALGLSNDDMAKSWKKANVQPMPRTGKELHIGICWAGDPNHDNDKWRSAPLNEFLRLCEIPGATVYSLQFGPHTADLNGCATHGIVKDLAPYIRDVADTAAIIAADMDVIVTVDTALAHIAGSVGAKTYMLVSKRGLDWRWMEGEGKTIWYPNTTLYRQRELGNWAELIERVKRDIEENGKDLSSGPEDQAA